MVKEKMKTIRLQINEIDYSLITEARYKQSELDEDEVLDNGTLTTLGEILINGLTND